MPFQESPYFNTPPDKEPLWKYMSIDKFMYMLSEKALYFSNIPSFCDRKEGELSKNTLEKVWRKTLLNVNNTPLKQDKAFRRYKDFINYALEKDHVINVKDIHAYQYTQSTFDALLSNFSNHFMFCNCWFLSPTESHSMWAEYGDKNPTSIAIKTTVEDLKNSLFDVSEYHIHIGKVKYKDYQKEEIEGYEDFASMDFADHDKVLELFYAPVMHKRNIYKDEHEVRAIISFESICNNHADRVYTSEIPFYSDRLFRRNISYLDYDKTHLMKHIPTEGIPIRADLERLIKLVVMSPNRNSYFYKPLKKLMQDNGLDPDIVYRSDI